MKTGVALAFIAGLLVALAHPDYRQGEPSLSGTPAHDFALTLDGKPAHLSDLRGQVVLLNFWATWCPPCVDEAPSLNQLQRHIQPLGGTVLGVSVDEDENAYEKFRANYNLSFPTYRDPSQKIGLEYHIGGYPETFVIGRNGRIDRKIVGPQDWTSSDMMAYLDSLLSRK